MVDGVEVPRWLQANQRRGAVALGENPRLVAAGDLIDPKLCAN